MLIIIMKHHKKIRHSTINKKGRMTFLKTTLSLFSCSAFCIKGFIEFIVKGWSVQKPVDSGLFGIEGLCKRMGNDSAVASAFWTDHPHIKDYRPKRAIIVSTCFNSLYGSKHASISSSVMYFLMFSSDFRPVAKSLPSSQRSIACFCTQRYASSRTAPLSTRCVKIVWLNTRPPVRLRF